MKKSTHFLGKKIRSVFVSVFVCAIKRFVANERDGLLFDFCYTAWKTNFKIKYNLKVNS
jgi:hypothetical protein